MRIYTKTGDKGMSSLYGGARISKSSARMSAYGTVDELNSFLGVIVAHGPNTYLRWKLVRVQEELLMAGSDLATPADINEKLTVVRLSDVVVKKLEEEIDEMTKDLPELRHFILPSGSITGAQLHYARAICRRAERYVVALADEEEINPFVIQYLNRLSDWLFTAARYQNQHDKVAETEWIYKA